MYRSLGRRLSFGATAAAVAAFAFAAFAFAAPAGAAAASVDVTLPDVTVAAGAGTQIAPIFYANRETTLFNTTLTFELSESLAGLELKDDGRRHCESTGPAKLTCALPYEFSTGPDGTVGDYVAELTAARTALGRTGKVTATLTADGVETTTATADVTVVSGVDLVAGDESEISAAPGAGFDAKLRVRNNSDEVVNGAAVIFNTDYAFSSPRQFSNCWYGDDQVNACVFDDKLQPGATYGTTVPYRLRAGTAAPGGAAGEFQWLTGDDYQDLLDFLAENGYDGPGAQGTGGPLALTTLVTARSAKQTDVDPDNNWQRLSVKVTGRQGTDIAAVGATATGAKGDTVTLPVGVRNDGPATVDRSRSGSSATTAVVTIPAKAEVVTVPEGCVKADDDSVRTNPGALQYACFTAPLFPVATTVVWKFGVRLTDDVTDARGLVEANPECTCDGFSGDINPKNDTASIVINPVAAPGGPGDGAGNGTGGEDGGQGGGGGTLPITGSQTALVGAAGAVLVTAGVVGFVLARRRRTRFEA